MKIMRGNMQGGKIGKFYQGNDFVEYGLKTWQ